VGLLLAAAHRKAYDYFTLARFSDWASGGQRLQPLALPAWDPEICIQCGKCAIVCPHATIRIKAYDENLAQNAPKTSKWMTAKGSEFQTGMAYTIQVAPEDCTGCGICVDVCLVKNKKQTQLKAINMVPQLPIREQERINYEFFLDPPEYDRRLVRLNSVKTSQLLQPLFEYAFI